MLYSFVPTITGLEEGMSPLGEVEFLQTGAIIRIPAVSNTETLQKYALWNATSWVFAGLDIIKVD